MVEASLIGLCLRLLVVNVVSTLFYVFIVPGFIYWLLLLFFIYFLVLMLLLLFLDFCVDGTDIVFLFVVLSQGSFGNSLPTPWVGVRSAYTLPFPDPIYGILLGCCCCCIHCRTL